MHAGTFDKPQTPTGRRPIWVLALFVAVVFAAFVTWKEMLPRIVVPAPGRVLYDDFRFSVLSAKVVGADEYVVTVQCENEAKRVPFTFRSDMISVRDAGRELPTTKGTWTGKTVLPVGGAEVRQFRVRGPAGLSKLNVWFRTGGDFGDFMDGLIDRNYAVEVPVK